MNITDRIEQYIRNINFPDTPSTLYDPIRYTLGLRGKYIRPKLALLSCGLNGGNPDSMLPGAASIEMLHNFTLIHDDIMDNAMYRRGISTVYKKWGIPAGILSGDALFVYALEQLNGFSTYEDLSKDRYVSLISIYLETIRKICEGQAMDMEFGEISEISINDYILMIQNKTAVLLMCAMKMGAIVAGKSKGPVIESGNIGLNAGLAFQIQDDLLDVLGSPDTTGKKKGGDIIEGKKTILYILAMKKASNKEGDFLSRILHSKSVSDDDVKNVVSLYDKLGVINDAADLADQYYTNALKSLDRFSDSEYKDEIKSLINQLMLRKY